MSSPVFPLEIRARIYNLLDDHTITELVPEVFWAIAPTFFKDLRIGASYGSEEEQLQNDLVQLHPLSGNFVSLLNNHNCHLLPFTTTTTIEYNIKHIKVGFIQFLFYLR
jgi:hypothetical protein